MPVEDYENLATEIVRMFSGHQENSFDDSAKVIEELSQNGRVKAVLTYGNSPQDKRIIDPLEFKSVTGTIDLISNTENTPFLESAALRVFLKQAQHRVTLFAKICNPEPAVENLTDILGIMQALKLLSPLQLMVAASLTGAGASAPHHFHSHLMPLVYGCYGESGKPVRIGELFKANINSGSDVIWSDNGIELKEITGPIWGLQIRFAEEEYTIQQMSKILHMAIHRGVRYRSQLRLSYNLYIRTTNPNVVTVLFRKAQDECPFRKPEIIELLRNKAGAKIVEQICKHNSLWRWGWTECIGWLNPIDNSFPSSEFGYDFWQGVYHHLTIDQILRTSILQQVKEGLGLEGWAKVAGYAW